MCSAKKLIKSEAGGLWLYFKETPAQFLPEKFWETFKNNFVQKHLQRAAFFEAWLSDKFEDD